jgi:hypothetical protein
MVQLAKIFNGFTAEQLVLRAEFQTELFEAGEAVSRLLFDAPWHSECCFAVRKMAIDYIVKNFLSEAINVLRKEGLDAARQVIGWDSDIFSRHARNVALAIRTDVVKLHNFRNPMLEL